MSDINRPNRPQDTGPLPSQDGVRTPERNPASGPQMTWPDDAEPTASTRRTEASARKARSVPRAGMLGLIAAALIGGVVLAALLLGGETRDARTTDGATKSPAATGSGSGVSGGPTTGQRTGTFDDKTNTSPVPTGTPQPK
jgi:hypothetical protein